LLDYGLPEEVARNYAQVGCVETFLPGLGAPWTDCYLNLAKCLELALNDGCDMLTDHRLGPETGEPRQFDSFDTLFAAYKIQVKHALYQMLKAKDEYDKVVSQYEPEPLLYKVHPLLVYLYRLFASPTRLTMDCLPYSIQKWFHYNK